MPDQPTRLPPLTGNVAVLTIIGLSQLVSGCEQPISQDFFPQPPRQAFRVTTSNPLDRQQDVARNTNVRVRFTSRPDPDALSELTVSMTADQQPVTVDLRADLLDCEVVARPLDLLSPGVEHRLNIDPSLQNLYRVNLDGAFELVFTTGDATQVQPPPFAVSDQEIEDRLFAPHCGCCHSPPGGAYRHVLALQPSLLSHQPSRQVPSRVLVQPGRHDNSYLMHKVLGLPTIEGEPMPPPGMTCDASSWPEDRGCTTQDQLLDLLARWIDGLQP